MDLQELSPYDLGLTGSADAITFLVKYLKQGSHNEKRLAASAVRKLIPYCKGACNQAVPALLSCLNDPAPQVRQYVLKTLEELDVPVEAYDLIKKVSASDEKEYNRVVANRILSRDLVQKQIPNIGLKSSLTNWEKALSQESEDFSFRSRFPPIHRTMDGHMVRSKAEILIDNWLYTSGIAHAYERKVPVEEDLYCDFYIPAGKVYIEYWGLEGEPKYIERKTTKKEIYKRYKLNLIEIQDEHIKCLDDCLPKFLLKYGVRVSN